MERKLASIQKIKALSPIEGADFIEKAEILGWQCVTQVGEFKVGDLCVYIEIDSVVPEIPEFEFMRNKHFKVKTLRLKKTLSQGLAVPLSVLPEGEYNEGDDVTSLLGVTKFEPPVPLELDGKVLGCRPSFVYKTQEMRIQSMPGLLGELRGKEVYISTKIDGTSMSVYYNSEFDIKDAFGVCNRSWELKPSNKGAYWRTARRLGLFELLSQDAYCNTSRIVIQGELAGPGINKNRLGLKDTDFFVFNIWMDDKLINLSSMVGFCKEFGLSTVPIEETLIFDHSITWLLERAKGKYVGTDNQKEGIVIRPVEPVLSPLLNFHHLSAKIVSNDYLLKDK